MSCRLTLIVDFPRVPTVQARKQIVATLNTLIEELTFLDPVVVTKTLIVEEWPVRDPITGDRQT